MKYTRLEKYNKIWLELNKLKTEPFDLKKCFAHPSYFAYHFLGVTPYRYQHLILRKFRKTKFGLGLSVKNDRIIIVKSRQIGISLCLACLAIWFASTNQCKTGIHKDTKVGIISRDDNAAKKLMKEIQNLSWNGQHGLRDLIEVGRKTPFNKKEFHFKGGMVKCFAPTHACRGETFDLLIVDEAGFVDDIPFKEAMEPTVSAVDGKIILSSTPNGQKGFFYELFDPSDLKEEHNYLRYWFNWKMCENEVQRRIIRQEREIARKDGRMKSFDQEYNAMFTVDESAFFEDQDVENGIGDFTFEYESDLPCAIAIDYGLTTSGTCISVIGDDKGVLKLLFQFDEVDFDENKIMSEDWENSIPNLKKRFKNCKHYVVDACPQGNRTNRQLINEGYPVIEFNFRSDEFKGERNRGYYRFKSALKQGKIKYPDNRDLIAQMKSLQEVRMEGGKYQKVKAPRGYRDDRCDSFMMGAFPFLQDDNNFSSTIVEYKEAAEKIEAGKAKRTHDGRHDYQWDKLRLKDEKN